MNISYYQNYIPCQRKKEEPLIANSFSPLYSNRKNVVNQYTMHRIKLQQKLQKAITRQVQPLNKSTLRYSNKIELNIKIDAKYSGVWRTPKLPQTILTHYKNSTHSCRKLHVGNMFTPKHLPQNKDNQSMVMGISIVSSSMKILNSFPASSINSKRVFNIFHNQALMKMLKKKI